MHEFYPISNNSITCLVRICTIQYSGVYKRPINTSTASHITTYFNNSANGELQIIRMIISIIGIW